MQPILSIKDVGHSYDGINNVIQNVNLNIYSGEFVALVGPSGCGKSTLFKAILGTHPPTLGSIWMDGKGEITCPCRDVGIVYQQYSLYEFRTAKENVAFGLILDKTSLPFRLMGLWKWWEARKQYYAEAQKLLDRVGLGTHADAYPRSLSGGMRQRVAIAQALILYPKVLLLDEPFGALDESTRESLQKLLLELYWHNVKVKEDGGQPPYTIILVTHELNEAFYIADRVVGLSQYHNNGFAASTIVYDQAAPVFKPDDPRNFGIFYDQKEQLRDIVFNGKNKSKGNEYIANHQEVCIQQA